MTASGRTTISGRHASVFQVPGTPVFVGTRRLERALLDVFVYDSDNLRELHDAGVAACRQLADGPGVTWVNVSGVHDVALLAEIAERFELHPMTLEDLANTSQRPKWEEFSSYGFLAIKMLDFDPVADAVRIEHVSLVVGRNWVLTFLEDAGDVFDSIRERLRSHGGRVREMGADYLAYALLDTVVDHYFLTVEQIGDRVEVFDDRLLSEPQPGDIQSLHHYKRNLMVLRRAVWPLREVGSAVAKSETGLISEEARIFWRDLYDHVVQVIDMVETSRDMLSSMHDTYLSSLSNKMNEVMKVLTIISTIFIPLTFIAGIYGMNFQYMPELHWKEGYLFVWGLMIAISIALLFYFRRRRWL